MDSNPEVAASRFTPTPIPESQAFKWDDLLPPTQRALRELLAWLMAACETSTLTPIDEHLSTSLLVAGARGSGKTTVLLSAARALREWQRFLGWKDDLSLEGADVQHKELASILRRIEGRIAWLEPLDLEPLPARANLLATLLVRVRAAIDGVRSAGPSRRQGSWAPVSILEESAEDTWGKLDQLVRDASFMWEDFPSATDARVRAEQQIKASEIYANFQRRFGDAMEQVASTLALPRFGPSERGQVILVLPIDNVDRSTEHLYNIVKLTRMVTSRRLWFVLAAGHQEFQLFMERSFQKELLISSSAQPLLGPKGRDETLAIARRQAATTLRRALPPSYRIHIAPVAPEEAWMYPYRPGVGTQGTSGTPLRLHELLERLRVPVSSSRGHALKSFADLFDLSPRLSPSVEQAYRAALRELEARQVPAQGDTRHPLLTNVARQALTLSARTLQDLWHAAYREWKSPQEDDGEKAVRVVVEMLRNAIDESELPAWASQQLHNRIIRQDAQGKIILDLMGKPVNRAKRTSLSDVMEWPRWMSHQKQGARSWKEDPSCRGVLASELHLRRFHDVVLVQNDLDKPGNRVNMPSSVAGWFVLLHDLLMLFPAPRVLNVEVTPSDISPELVVTLHELFVERSETEPVVKLDFLWSLPTWDTFIDFSIFTMQWKAFLHEARSLFTFHPNPTCVERLFRFVLAAWVDNVCSVAGLARGGWELSGEISRVIAARVSEGELDSYERKVRLAINGLLRSIREGSKGYDRLWMARVWLEQSLPLLTLPEFSPSPKLSQLLLWKQGDDQDRSDWDALVEHWENHLHRLTRTRQNGVRAVVMRSGAYELLRQTHVSTGSGQMRVLHDWLGRVTRAWFAAVDGERRSRKLEVLKELAPDALDEHLTEDTRL